MSKLTDKATFGDQVYEKFKSIFYEIQGYFSDDLIDELYMRIEAQKLGLNLKSLENK